MRKLLCVNARILKFTNPDGKIQYCRPAGLTEGYVYTTRGEKYTGKMGRDCYYIDDVGERLALRFTNYLDDDMTEEDREADKALTSLKNELNLN
jgi:hypothetical protein